MTGADEYRKVIRPDEIGLPHLAVISLFLAFGVIGWALKIVEIRSLGGLANCPPIKRAALAGISAYCTMIGILLIWAMMQVV